MITRRVADPVTAPDEDQSACTSWVLDPARVARVRARMWPDDVVSDTADLFKVLGSTTRIRILRALAVEELCVCELSELLGMTSSAVSHQLRDLRNLKLVRLRSEGKLAFYRVADPSLLALVEVAIGRCSPGAALAGGDRS